MPATPEDRQHETALSSAAQTLSQMINGGWVAQMISVVAKLGIADLLADGAKSSAELAERTGTHARSLYRVLRALASRGVFAEDERGRFTLTPLGELLRTGTSGSVRSWAVLVGDAHHWRPRGDLAHSVATGGDALRHAYGVTNWEYRAQHPEANTLFNHAMTSLSARRVVDVVAAYDFSGIETIVDVGGGHGALIAAILKNYPRMRGILFDLPHVVAGAPQVLEPAGVADRCRLVGGDAFEEVPAGGDAYIMSKVIHDWGDDRVEAQPTQRARDAASLAPL